MDFENTTLSFKRPLTSYSKVRQLVAACIRNRRFQARRPAVATKAYLDLGCGPNTHPGFISLDYLWHPGIDVCWDITRPIPFPDATLAGIFTEHCLEHLPFASVDFVLSECWRVLKPGGTIRIVVPDGELYLTQYVGRHNGSQGTLPYADGDAWQGLYSPMMSVNRIFRGSGHQFIYDFDTLRLLCDRNRFVNVTREAFRKGRDPQLLIDTDYRAVESLYLEGSRPKG